MLEKKWKYVLYEQKGLMNLSIEPPAELKKSLPNFLYKFYELNENNISSFFKSYFYGSYYSIQNDVFEFNSEILFIGNSFKEFMNNITESYYSFDEIPKNLTDQEYFNMFRVISANFIAVLSLTDQIKSDLMWSHYAKNDGFSIEYNIKN